MMLVGDVGATKTLLALVSTEGQPLTPVLTENFSSQKYRSLEALLHDFFQGDVKLTCACFGVPGPVVKGSAEIVNLDWTIDGVSLEREFRIPRVFLLNDLEAMAHGIAELGQDNFLVLNKGRVFESATAALIAAGTGLGESVLYWDGKHRVPIPCEAGHADFAPRNPLEFRLHGYLQERFEYVSWERVLSGPGLVNVYGFLKDIGHGVEEAWAAEEMRTSDPSGVIADAALQGRSPLCEKALDLFVSLYGAEAGNLALRAVAVGGVYLGGGIAPKIRQKLADGTFMKEFVAKDRMTRLLSDIPVRVILEERTGLLGAARFARSRLSNEKTNPDIYTAETGTE